MRMLKDLLSEIIQGRILATYLAVFTVSWADLSEVVMIVFYIIGGSYAIWEWYHKYQDRKRKEKIRYYDEHLKKPDGEDISTH